MTLAQQRKANVTYLVDYWLRIYDTRRSDKARRAILRLMVACRFDEMTLAEQRAMITAVKTLR